MSAPDDVDGMVARYNALVDENARLVRMMEGRHALGTCPHCEHPERPRPVPILVFALAFGFSGALVASGTILIFNWMVG